MNPYICNDTEKKRLPTTREYLHSVTISNIICSPFLRCIQTALDIVNDFSINIIDKTIYIDFNLAEYGGALKDFMIDNQLNINDIFEKSLKYLDTSDTKRKIYPNKKIKLWDPSNYILYGENDTQYRMRIDNAFEKIKKIYSGRKSIKNY